MKKLYWLILLIFLLAVPLGGAVACGKEDTQKEVEDSVEEGSSGQKFSADVSDTQESVREDVVFENSFSVGETDVVLVMDESGSMAYADRERIAVEAAKLFIDMEKVSGANLALVEFSDHVSSTGLIEIKQEQNKDHLKDLLDQIPYGGKAHTDTGAALQEAVSILNDSDSAGKKAIILFTDGRTDIDDDTPGRTLENSLEEVNAAMEEAGKQGYPIYSVGLNADGSVDESELKKLASNTGGAYRIAKDVNELPDFFNQIFMEMKNIRGIPLAAFTADGSYKTVSVPIDSDNIMEANIVILYSNKLADVKIFDPDGNEIVENSDRVRFSTSDKYAVIKLINPPTRPWKLKVKGVSGDNIKISLLYNYNFTATTILSSSEVNIGDTVDIDLHLNSEGVGIKDEEFYKAIAVEASVKNEETGEEIGLVFTPSEEGLHSSYTPDRIGDYTVNIYLEGDKFYRDIEGIAFHVLPESVGIAEDEKLPLTGEPEEAADTEKETVAWQPVAAAAAAIVFLLFIVAVWKRGRRIDGKFMIGVKCRKNENGVSVGNDYTASTGIEGRNMNSSRLLLKDLLSLYERYYNAAERNETKKQELGRLLSDIRRYTKRVAIIGYKKSGHIRVHSKAGSAVKIYNMHGIEAGKSLEMDANTGGNIQLQGKNGCSIKVTIPNGYVEITIRYSMM